MRPKVLVSHESSRIPASVSEAVRYNPSIARGGDADSIPSATPAKRKRGKSLSRRTGQGGHIEQSGRWFVVRFWKDIAGQEKRMHVRERICPASGPPACNGSGHESCLTAKLPVFSPWLDSVSNHNLERTVRISSADLASRSPIGSSATTMVGSVTMARAIATRCSCPPESCRG